MESMMRAQRYDHLDSNSKGTIMTDVDFTLHITDELGTNLQILIYGRTAILTFYLVHFQTDFFKSAHDGQNICHAENA